MLDVRVFPTSGWNLLPWILNIWSDDLHSLWTSAGASAASSRPRTDAWLIKNIDIWSTSCLDKWFAKSIKCWQHSRGFGDYWRLIHKDKSNTPDDFKERQNEKKLRKQWKPSHSCVYCWWTHTNSLIIPIYRTWKTKTSKHWSEHKGIGKGNQTLLELLSRTFVANLANMCFMKWFKMTLPV